MRAEQVFFNRNKIQLDQSTSFYYHDEVWEWFARTFFKYDPFPGWTFNASFQVFKGNTYRLINSANYLSSLEVYAPQERSMPRFF